MEKAVSGLAAGESVGVFHEAAGELADNIFIFLAFQRTGGINESTSRRQNGERRPKNLHLSLGLASELLWSDAPLDLGVSSKRAGAGAGGIDENAVELPTSQY